MSHSTRQPISDVGLSRRVMIPLFVILGLSALPSLLFAPLGVGISVLAAVVPIGALAAFSRVKVTADDEGLSARCMGIFRVTFAWNEVISIEEGPATGLGEGAGYRVLSGGRVGLLVGGPTVEVRDSRRAYLLSVDDPETVTEELRQHLATAHSRR